MKRFTSRWMETGLVRCGLSKITGVIILFCFVICMQRIAFGARCASVTSIMPGFALISAFGNSGVYAGGINNLGQVVGYYAVSGQSTFHGFLESCTSTTTIDVGGAGETLLSGINDHGEIVGIYSDSAGTHGFRQTNNATQKIDAPGATNTNVFGINDAGQNVGGGEGATGFILTGNTFTTIPIGTVADINNVGQIVGYYGLTPGSHGFVQTGATVTTIDVPGALNTFAYGINDAGQIVGYYEDGNGVQHGFLRTGTTITALEQFSRAQAINNAGAIVGIPNAFIIPVNQPLLKFSACDVNEDQAVNVLDVQLIVNQALGLSPPVSDVNGDGVVNVLDVQHVVDAALEKACYTG